MILCHKYFFVWLELLVDHLVFQFPVLILISREQGVQMERNLLSIIKPPNETYTKLLSTEHQALFLPIKCNN